MRKYKLIKTYPRSPKLGYILEETEDGFDLPDNDKEDCMSFTEMNYLPEDYPDFWKKIIEKDSKN